MSRSDGSAHPGLPANSEHRAVNAALHRSMGDEGWSVEQVVVGEHVHLVAKCFCASCLAIREEEDERDFRERPQHRWFGKCSLPSCETCGAIMRDLALQADEEMRAARSWERYQERRALWEERG